MKPLYRCEYCDQTGTAEEIREHEATCTKNYNLKSCWTCKHYDGIKNWNALGSLQASCKLKIELPVNIIKQDCPSYERHEENNKSPYSDLVRTLFGGSQLRF